MLATADKPQRLMLVLRRLSVPAAGYMVQMAHKYCMLWRDELSFAFRLLPGDPRSITAMEIAGPGAWPLVAAEEGVHMWCRFHESLLPLSVSFVPRTEQTLEDQLRDWQAERQQWLDSLAENDAATSRDPRPLGRIVRFYDTAGPTLDLRTGSTLPQLPTAAQHKSLILGGLALPPEMEI
jgi:hypothetical protein